MFNVTDMEVCLFLLSLCVSIQGQVPNNRHVYLGYISPFNFVKAFSQNARPYLYHRLRARRSSITAHNSYSNMPAHRNYFHNYNPYPFNYNYNSMFVNPFSQFSPMMHFPRFSLPFMTHFPYYPNSRPGYGVDPNQDHFNSDPFGSHFMKMMGFDFNKAPSFPVPPATKGSGYSNGYNYGNAQPYSNGDGKNYEMSYSKSYTMNAANGKGHMVMKDSSYVNNNGKVEMHDNPAQHFTMNANGNFVPDNNYNQN